MVNATPGWTELDQTAFERLQTEGLACGSRAFKQKTPRFVNGKRSS